MKENYDYLYLSNYAKQLSRQCRLEETSGDIFDKITNLSSFREKISPTLQKSIDIDVIKFEIGNYLKKNGYLERNEYAKKVLHLLTFQTPIFINYYYLI